MPVGCEAVLTLEFQLGFGRGELIEQVNDLAQELRLVLLEDADLPGQVLMVSLGVIGLLCQDEDRCPADVWAAGSFWTSTCV